jgi:hypothetical protein
MDFQNGTQMRKDNDKPGPSGMSRNEVFSLPESWGGWNCLLEVDMAVVQGLKEAMGGDEILKFVSPDFAQHAQAAYNTLGITDLNLENVGMYFVTCIHLYLRYKHTLMYSPMWMNFVLLTISSACPNQTTSKKEQCPTASRAKTISLDLTRT